MNTALDKSKDTFSKTYPEILDGLLKIKDKILQDKELKDFIEKKYQIKNTMGYALNSFIDFKDPIDILQHLIVGSEGTLGFISEITYNTVEDHKFKTCGLLFFSNLRQACEAATLFRQYPIAAAELMDHASLLKVKDKPGMPDVLQQLGPDEAALLIELRAENQEVLDLKTLDLQKGMQKLKLSRAPEFTNQPIVYDAWWKIRKGLFPAVGKGRQQGTTVIIEDVAFPHEHFASATEDLVQTLSDHGYKDAILFGHVLDSNVHFVFAQDFASEKEVLKYDKMMNAVSELVAKKWKGSLKAEHGTGRNMAPFVEKEWGKKAYALMQELKNLLDPMGILNPDVILSSNPNLHLENLKITPAVDPLIDECIECGFCEVHCPSKDLTITPRQRIATFRELHRKPKNQSLIFEKEMQYKANETCATDGMCLNACPVNIDTGVFIKSYRFSKAKPIPKFLANQVAIHFSLVLRLMYLGVYIWSCVPKFIKNSLLEFQSLKIFAFIPYPAAQLSKSKMIELAQWHDSEKDNLSNLDLNNTVIYFSSCISRVFSQGVSSKAEDSLVFNHLSVLEKAGYKVILPKKLNSHCCGLPFESKGFFEGEDLKTESLKEELIRLSQNGLIPIVCDNSPCTYRLLKKLSSELKIYDSVKFVSQFILNSTPPKILVDKNTEPLAMHITCSSKHMGLESDLLSLARACSSEVIIPQNIDCCGFAGDKGFTHPELNDSALKSLNTQIPDHCHTGVSNSRTCEIGLTKHSGREYSSIIQKLDEQAHPIR